MSTTGHTNSQVVLSVPEAAELLGWTELATRRAIERGQLPARRWGRRVIILREDFEAHLRALPLREVVRPSSAWPE
jgi:excisionase family DNA binding protein